MERTELVEAVDFLINTGTLNQLVEVAVSEVKRQPSDDWCSRTCGECGWSMLNGDCIFCRRVSWNLIPINNNVQYSGHGAVQQNTPACPAFVAREVKP